MVYISIDDKTPESKLLIEYLSLQKFVHIYKEPNLETEQAFLEVENNQATKVKNFEDLMIQLKD